MRGNNGNLRGNAKNVGNHCDNAGNQREKLSIEEEITWSSNGNGKLKIGEKSK